MDTMASFNKNTKIAVTETNQRTDLFDTDDQSNKNKKLRRPNHALSNSITPSTQICNRTQDSNPVGLLDMLAEVASAELKNDPVLTPRTLSVTKLKSPTPTSTSPIRRTACNSDLLNLDQIRMLSDRLLLNMFSEQSADELRKTYTFTCYLMPEKCQQKYSSFGNEHKARLLMKTHLLAHIAELVSEDNKPDRSPDRKFIAETLNARKKRLAGNRRRVLRKNTKTVKSKKLIPTQVKDKIVKGVTISTSKTTNSTPESGKFTRIIPLPPSNERLLNEVDIEKIKENGDKSYERTDSTKKQSISKTSYVNGTTKSVGRPSKVTSKTICEDNSETSNLKKGSSRPRKRKRICETSEASTETSLEEEQTSVETATSTEFVLKSELPCDHTYTYLNGKKAEMYHWEAIFPDDDEEILEKETIYPAPIISEGSINLKSAIYSRLLAVDCTVPTFPHLNSLTDPLVGQVYEVVSPRINQRTTATLKEADLLEGVVLTNKPKRIRRINKIIVPEEYATESSDTSEEEDEENESDESDKPVNSKAETSKSASKASSKEGSPEWERKLALKCIRMLRTKKKDERVTLVCKICQDKIFTAQATLMYHYRSHAGIKPFVCNICNTTFTRQHSLNYHMLIHNNKSRFTCVECGRKFRHPSHFKEHMRRHTGETPFECTDCGLRFKTRNTYKRHLKTRHGKLLTANGIVVLTSEEFLRVKTNPRKKTSQRKDKETQWPDADYKPPAQKSEKVTVKYCNELKLTPAIVQKHLKKSP